MVGRGYQTWAGFYMALADALRPYEQKRTELIEKIVAVFADIDMRLPKLERDGKPVDIDPFTIFALFNKGLLDKKRIAIIEGLARAFGIENDVPRTFEGIPVVNNQAATFYYFIGDRGERDIDNLWRVFSSALDFSDSHSELSRKAFCEAFDDALQQKGIRWNMTMGLFWIRPYEFINLDSRNRWYIYDRHALSDELTAAFGVRDNVPSGAEYLEFCERANAELKQGKYTYDNFPELSCHAWTISEEVNKENREAEKKAQKQNVGEALGDEGIALQRYWIYTPGYGAEMWDAFYDEGIMGIAREYIGDLNAYESRSAMQKAMQKHHEDHPDPTIGATSFKNASLETWQFVHDIKPGDVIFAKRGKHVIIGRGIVESDYFYDDSNDHTGDTGAAYRNLRRVRWTHKGTWEHPEGAAINKVLTDITPYTEYVAQLNALFEGEENLQEEEVVAADLPVYTADDFLKQVYMTETEYVRLTDLLKRKKNIVLQGAPGVGKTFAAKRLAYSMMGVKDPNRVMMVQFHQSYSYEDFIEGYRPEATGFKLNKGAFYNFCKRAEMDGENDYFFIIDEINRGNLSKIFGELFMLIEGDKRGIPLQLLYSNEKFAVPERVHIIGMMNTADRSLAMLDYALRRRFAFYDMKPGFEAEGFRQYKDGLQNDRFNCLINCVESLNRAIAEDDALGEGFCIGHSYFCNLTPENISEQTLSEIVEYELIPLLKEYWFDEAQKVKDWTYKLRSAIQ